MIVKVIDASALAALLFDEPEAALISQRIQGARLTAPTLLAFELANICRTKCRRHPDRAGDLSAAFGLRAQIRIEEMAVAHGEVVPLALQTGLTAYDASYLWLARRLNAELVTLDKQLEQVSAKP